MAARGEAVVVAAGRGVRAGGDFPKQYKEIAGEPVLRRSLLLFARDARIGAVQPVIPPDDDELFERAAQRLALLPRVYGRATPPAPCRPQPRSSVFPRPRRLIPPHPALPL